MPKHNDPKDVIMSVSNSTDFPSNGASRPDPIVPDATDIYPVGTQNRLCSVAMALQGVVQLFNEINDGGEEACGVAGVLDLAVAELTRINSELEASCGS
jgi:hypothetical protein